MVLVGPTCLQLPGLSAISGFLRGGVLSTILSQNSKNCNLEP